jgi:hypothetical protein
MSSFSNLLIFLPHIYVHCTVYDNNFCQIYKHFGSKTKIFLIIDFFHLPPVSTTPVVNLELRISPRIFGKNRNGPNGILWGWGGNWFMKKTRSKKLWHCPFKRIKNYTSRSIECSKRKCFVPRKRRGGRANDQLGGKGTNLCLAQFPFMAVWPRLEAGLEYTPWIEAGIKASKSGLDKRLLALNTG